jgi:predicted dehydrogenase
LTCGQRRHKLARNKPHLEENYHTVNNDPSSRRSFLKTASVIAMAVTVVPRHVLGQGQTPPSQRLNVAGIGVGGMGAGDVDSCAQAGENIVALCDPDRNNLAASARKYPGAKLYTDFRKMLETQKDIDAVTIATPDHVHAVATAMAMKLGKHVHCQKPLTHSVYEARMIGKIARETKVATQMGNFGQAGEEARRVAEMIWAGAIGTLKEVHAWSNRKPDISQRGVARPKETPPCPAHLDWDLWVGPAPMRPYHPCYHPFAWRGWWDFGTGVLGDIGCHELSAVFKAMKIGDPVSVEACSTNWQRPKEISDETAPLASITHYKFAASDTHGPLSIFWYDGGMRPPRPEALDPEAEFATNDGTMYVGDRGIMLRDRLIPASKSKESGGPPQKLARSAGHWKEFLDACRGGKPAGSNFADHAAHLAEVVLLGNIAIRMNQKLEWDAVNMKFPNYPEADEFVNPPYRHGFML